MFTIKKRIPHLGAVFAFLLIAAACGGSATDVDDDAAGDAASGDSVVVADEVMTSMDPSDDMDSAGHTDDGTAEDDNAADHDDAEAHDEEGHSNEDEEGHSDEGEEGHSDEGGDEEIPEDARIVFATMNEWGYDPESFTVAAGETVAFLVNNAGSFPHEFRLSNAHRIEEHIESGHEGHGGETGEGGHHGEDGDLVLELQPGKTGQLVVVFPEDTTLFTDVVCLLPGHYENGMFTSLTYEAN